MASYCHMSDMNKMQKMFKRRRSLHMPYIDLVKQDVLNWDLINRSILLGRCGRGREMAKENIPKGIIEGTSQSWGSETYIQEIMANHLMNTWFT